MIFEVLLVIMDIILGIVLFPFEIIPDLPTELEPYYDHLKSILSQGAIVFRMIVGETFRVPLFVLVVLAYNAKWIYKLAIWVIKKVPISSS